MDIQTLCDRAWQIAEDKGLHANLDGVATLGARGQALLACAPVFLRLVHVLQVLKKQGVSLEVWDQALFDLEHTLQDDIGTLFDQLLHLCGDQPSPVPVTHTHIWPSTTLRLLLVGTEVGEALDVVHDRASLGRELADIVVRVADMAQGLGIDLDAACTAVMDANDHRPYAYGTPAEQKEP